MTKQEKIIELKKKIKKIKMDQTMFTISRGEIDRLERYRKELKQLEELN